MRRNARGPGACGSDPKEGPQRLHIRKQPLLRCNILEYIPHVGVLTTGRRKDIFARPRGAGA